MNLLRSSFLFYFIQNVINLISQFMQMGVFGDSKSKPANKKNIKKEKENVFDCYYVILIFDVRVWFYGVLKLF